MVDILFQLLNVGIVIFLGVYVFRNFLAPMFRGKLEQEHLLVQNLHEEHNQLLLSQRELEESLKAQQADCGNLVKRIDHWREEVYSRYARQEEEKRQMYQAVEERVRIQSYNHALKKMQRQVSLTVTDKLEKELTQYFTHQLHVDQYMQSTIEKLKKI